MRQKNQKMRFNDVDLGLMKATFADNEDLLFVIRKVLLQFDLTEEEQDMINGMSEAAHNVVRKEFLSELDPEAPLFQLSDMRIALKNDINVREVDQMALLIHAKELEMDYIRQQLDVLKGGEEPEKRISLENLVKIKGKDKEDLYVEFTAWTYLVSYIDSCINEMKNLAGTPDETVEETMKKLAKNSNK